MNSSSYCALSGVLSELRNEYDETQRELFEIKASIHLSDNSKISELEKKLEILSSQIIRLQNSIICDTESNDEEKSFNLSILNIQEEDRQRIARDLHDTSLQNLAHLVHKLELCGLYMDTDVVRAKLELTLVGKRLREVIDEIRNTIFDLRPMTFDDLGFQSTLERFLDIFNESGKYKITRKLDNVSCENQIVLVTIYRIIQECFNNISKHSNAGEIYFECVQDGSICNICIEDNGVGFSFDEVSQRCEKHFGLNVIRERVHLLGGDIVIDSEINVGTKIAIKIPLC